MARTIFGEARGELEIGQIGVAWVIRNRACWQPPTWWGTTPAAVCTKPQQFSCWNASDPNRVKLMALDQDDPTYQAMLEIATEVMNGVHDDPTGCATHYEVIGTGAAWAKDRPPSATLGRHAFYAIGPH